MKIPRFLKGTTIASLVAVLILPFVLPSTSLAIEVLIFSIAALGCNLLLGYTGLLSFGQGIFFGMGSYATSLCLQRLDAGLVTSLLLAFVVGGLVAAVVGGLSIRRRGIYFVMLTLAFAQMFYFMAYTASGLTGGDNGLLDVPRPPLRVFGFEISTLGASLSYYVFVAVLFLAIFVALRRIIHSPFGSTLLAIRDNEERATAIGYNTRYFKIVAFMISGSITAVAGGLYAMFLNFAPLSNIEHLMGEQILFMTIIGGTGSLFGSFLGAGFLIVVGDVLSAIWPRWLMLLGFLLIAIVLFMRGGLWGCIESLMGRFRGHQNTKKDPPLSESPTGSLSTKEEAKNER